jgi:hypothetical protein
MVMGLGAVANLDEAIAQVLAEPFVAARPYVKAQPAAYLSETGWRQRQQRAWLWVTVKTWLAVFVVWWSRGVIVAQELLGDQFCGYLVIDCQSTYTQYRSCRRHVPGASAKGYLRNARTGPALPRELRGLVRPSTPDVPLVALGLPSVPRTSELRPLYVADLARGGAAAGSGANLWCAHDGKGISGGLGGTPGPINIRPSREGGTNE